MRQPTHNFDNYAHVPCRTCMEDGYPIDTAIQPIVGILVGGDYLLRCGHQQETGNSQELVRRVGVRHTHFEGSVGLAHTTELVEDISRSQQESGHRVHDMRKMCQEREEMRDE